MLNDNYTVEYNTGHIATVLDMKKFVEDNYRQMHLFGSDFNMSHHDIYSRYDLHQDRGRICWYKQTYIIATDCLGIIRNSRGRIVMPNVLVDYYNQRYTYQKPYQFKSRRSVYGYRHYKHAKRMMKDFLDKPYEDEPPIRKSSKVAVCNVIMYDAPYRSIEKSWKCQSKKKRQWM